MLMMVGVRLIQNNTSSQCSYSKRNQIWPNKKPQNKYQQPNLVQILAPNCSPLENTRLTATGEECVVSFLGYFLFIEMPEIRFFD